MVEREGGDDADFCGRYGRVVDDEREGIGYAGS